MAEKTYEEAMTRLDEIIDLLENNDSKNCTFVVTTIGLSQFSAASCIGFNSSLF